MKVLIVDDSEQSLFVLRRYLSDDFEVVCANNGAEGIKEFGENKDIKVVIADYNMPDMNGLEMIEKFTGIGHFKNTFVIMMTTETAPDLVNRAKHLGVVAWMLKPPEKLSLIEVIKTVTNNG